MKNKNIILQSIVNDLRRVTTSQHRGSSRVAKRFLKEACQYRKEIDLDHVPPYIQKLLKKIDENLESEEALMISTLIHNYSQS